MGKPIWNYHKPSRASTELSPREREVLCLLAQGCSSKGTATKMGISKKTVERHRASIRKKTGRQSIPLLTMLAIILKMVKIE